MMGQATVWTLLCLSAGTMGQIAYFADLLKPHVPGWCAVPFFAIPVALVLFVQPGEAPDRLVWRVHVLTAFWYTAVAVAVEIVSISGYAPPGSLFFRVVMHTGWGCCARVLVGRFRFPHPVREGNTGDQPMRSDT